MRSNQRRLLTLVGTSAILIGTIAAQGVKAHHRDWHQGGSPSSTSDTITTEEAITLTAAQRTFLDSLLNGTSDQNYLLTEEMREEIQAQIGTLPPGIQRRLARGRALPPGIAKKVTLPEQVNEEIGLDENLEITILGEDIAIIDPVTDLVVDLLQGIL